MERQSFTESLSSQDFEGLPSLNTDTEEQAKLEVRRPRTRKLKALSLPTDLKLRTGLKNMTYRISDNYNLMQKLGFGTYSEVRRAIDKKTEEVFAIKICKGTTSCKLLKKEAEIMKQISSEYIPKFYDFKQDVASNKAYLIMEYIEGKSLDTFIEERGTLTEKDANFLLAKLVAAVEELHSLGIAHRDIKPQNILVTDDLNLKLIDFNISKQTKERIGESKSADVKGTHTQLKQKFNCIFFTQISSPKYAAPEVLSLDCYSESIDIWGVGVAYAEMLFKFSNLSENTREDSNSETLSDIIDQQEVSDESISLLKSMLSKDPESRPSIFELSARLIE